MHDLRSETDVLTRVCERLDVDDHAAASAVLREGYPFVAATNSGRSYTPRQMTRVFMRDGFIDRYSGQRLIFPPVLRAITAALPNEFPAHVNWKMSATHSAYWDLFPTIDHVVPVARGGSDEEENWVTTSMTLNSAKGNSLLDQIGWELHEPGALGDWDGLGGWLLSYLDQRPELASNSYILRWARALRSCL